jgi:hypothetical protein
MIMVGSMANSYCNQRHIKYDIIMVKLYENLPGQIYTSPVDEQETYFDKTLIKQQHQLQRWR